MNETENKKEYEMAYILAPDIPEEKLDSEAEELKKIISESGGKITALDAPKKQRLAYPVKKQNYGYFGVAYFNVDTNDAGKEAVDKIKKVLALRKNLIRYLISVRPEDRTAAVSDVKEPNKFLSKSEPAIKEKKAADELEPAQSFDKKLESILNR